MLHSGFALGLYMYKPNETPSNHNPIFARGDFKRYTVVNLLYSGLMGLPKRSGKLRDLTSFDATFFNIHPKQANTMDAQVRLLLEVTYEAIVDAGKR